MTEIKEKAIAGLQVGDCFQVVRTFIEKDTLSFAEISRDFNPVHFNDDFVASKNFKGKICHGLLVGSLITEIGGQIGWLASGMTFSFKKPVYFGDTISCDFTIVEIKDGYKAKAEALFKNQHDDTVIESTLSGILPSSREREIILNNDFEPAL